MERVIQSANRIEDIFPEEAGWLADVIEPGQLAIIKFFGTVPADGGAFGITVVRVAIYESGFRRGLFRGSSGIP
jgi:hypothetical protein